MSSSQQTSASMSSQTSQANCLDPLDALIDFSDYETLTYQSPAISPSSAKAQFSRSVSATPTTNNTMGPSGSQQTLSGPSHQYDMYKQQTGIPTGSVANTLSVNSSNVHINNSFRYGMDYLSGLSPSDDFVDFGTAPRQTPYTAASDMDMEYESPNGEPAFFYPERSSQSSSGYVNPNAIGGQENQPMPASVVLPTQSSNLGRVWPGMHQQQAAIAKAQQQQRQQQQLIQQQRQQSAPSQQRPQQRRPQQAADPIVEEKISQLLNSMRQNSVANSDGDDASTPNGSGLAHVQRMRKEEEDMDEDERLLASEEGKKLSSKERRQLRNKVSARAFRSRRKEYIGQLEGEIATKVNENSDLRSQNRALLEENQRLSDLTRMLLSSPSFSGFLDNLSTNPNAAQQQQPQSAPAPVEQRPAENRQVRKDVNPYVAQQQMQHVGMTMIPEQTMDFSMLDLNGDGGFSYQPQVFSVLEVPEVTIDTSILSGKSSNFVGERFDSEDDKVEMPVIERAPVAKEEAPAATMTVIDEEFDADPAFALFADNTNAQSQAAPESPSIKSEKVLAHIELVDAEVDEAIADAAMAKVQRICAGLEAAAARLEALTIDL